MQVALAGGAGLLYFAAFPGQNQFYLAFVAFVPAMWAARATSPRRALFLGTVMGLVCHLIAYYWMTHLLQTFAFLPWAAAALGWVLLCGIQALSFGVGLALARWLRLKTGWPYAVTLAVGLTVMDFCYPLLFPSYIANTMTGVPWMMQICDLFGMLGLTALIGSINGAVVDVLVARSEQRSWPARTVAIVGSVWAATLVYGAIRTHQIDVESAAAPKLKVGLVQANFGGIETARSEAASLEVHRRLTSELTSQGIDLAVWPEGAVSYVIPPQANVRKVVLGGTPEALLFGAVRVAPDPGSPTKEIPFNSAFLADSTGQVVGSYDKTVLLMFGEYIPGGEWFPKIYEWIKNASHWGRGTSTAPLVFGDWRIGTYICYEDIIPRFVSRIMQPHDGRRPTLMVNITNDSWYGPYREQVQHLSLASFRAVEHHRALVRSTSTGISAIVDPAGRIVARTPTYVETTLVASVPRMEATTVYEIIGDTVGYLAVVVLVIGWWIGRRVANHSERDQRPS